MFGESGLPIQSSSFSSPDFKPTKQEKNRRKLEEIRRKHNPQNFRPIPWMEAKTRVDAALNSFCTNAEIAAQKGSRIVRLGLSPNSDSNAALITSAESRARAFELINREYGISADRVAFGTATRVTQNGEQQMMWVDIDFG